jgi:Bacterial protein of unknown function (DUF839)
MVLAIGLAVALPVSAIGAQAPAGFRTAEAAYLTLTADGKLIPILTVGEDAGVEGFTFEGLPDGIGIMPTGARTIDLFVNHEQSRVPFQGSADVQDSSVSQLSINTRTGGVLDASVAIGPEAGLIRFCSSYLAGPAEGFSNYTLFTNEESNDLLDVPAGAVYGSDPSIAPRRQAGYSVVLDAATGDYDVVPGLGRMNHENAVPIPGGWSGFSLLTGDDTFDAPASQLYEYRAPSEAAIWGDTGSLWAFQVTATQGGQVDETDPFNGANDYGDMALGDDWSGRFIRVPDDIARGTAAGTDPPQLALEKWSNANNVFQFIRVEDIAYDPAHPRTVYFADTGEARALDDAQWIALNPTVNTPSGRLHRAPSGNNGGRGFGRIFKLVMNADDPTVVDSFSILLDADTQLLTDHNGATTKMSHPDNVAIGKKSLMIQEDTSNSRIWRYSLEDGTWSVVATVNDPAGESSGIVDASAWFGPGWWMVDVQAHSVPYETSDVVGGVTIKRERGQLLLMKISGS